jgi:regulator of protease activity HflC (stomatin/prohibitin superfamily)
MVTLSGGREALARLQGSLKRKLIMAAGAFLLLLIMYARCTARVPPDELGIELRTLGSHSGIVERVYEPGLYFLAPGASMKTFPRGVQVLEASMEREESRNKAPDRAAAIDEYFEERNRILGDSHRVIPALNIQTSDGYAVQTDITLLYSVVDPVRVAKDFGWGTLYVDAFVINTFRNGVLATLGKMNAESFYDGALRIATVTEAEELLRKRFAERGFKVDKLLLRNFRYAENYERSLQDKKVAVQLAEKNRKEGRVNEERAKLQQIDSKGNGAITIAESAVNAEIAKIKAEADLYGSQTRAKADREAGLAASEAKRLKSDALTQTGGRYVMALEISKMFDNITGAAMTPEQYIAFIRNAWALIGLNPGGRVGPGGKQ